MSRVCAECRDPTACGHVPAPTNHVPAMGDWICPRRAEETSSGLKTTHLGKGCTVKAKEIVYDLTANHSEPKGRSSGKMGVHLPSSQHGWTVIFRLSLDRTLLLGREFLCKLTSLTSASDWTPFCYEETKRI